MNIIDNLRKAFIPRPCVICDEIVGYDLKVALCDDCVEEWDKQVNMTCNRCGNKKDDCKCISPLVKKAFPFICWSVFYTGSDQIFSPDVIVFNLKHTNSYAVFEFCAEMMKRTIISRCKAHNVDYREYAVTFTPRSKHNILKYGFDQSKEVAKLLAKKLGVPFVETLRNTGKKEQKKLNKIERDENARNSYALIKNFENKHKKYFLIDDVLTSGATMFHCARILFDAGAETIIPVAYCKDNIKKGDK